MAVNSSAYTAILVVYECPIVSFVGLCFPAFVQNIHAQSCSRVSAVPFNAVSLCSAVRLARHGLLVLYSALIIRYCNNP